MLAERPLKRTLNTACYTTLMPLSASNPDCDLPLLRFVTQQYEKSNLSDVTIVACQHILGTQLTLFDELTKRGLKAKNFFLIGKSYSTCRNVYRSFEARGVNISPFSLAYNSHISFDEQFERQIAFFFSDAMQRVGSASKLIIVDEGGYLTFVANKLFGCKLYQATGIEQTSSGYNRIANLQLEFPIINVARSLAKLQVESVFIAALAAQRIRQYFARAHIATPRILIVGQGAVGLQLQRALGSKYSVATFDVAQFKSQLKAPLQQHLSKFNVIVGATGYTVLGLDDLRKLSKDTHLISVSSSDREFPAVFLRRRFPASSNPHVCVSSQGVHLVNGGFPINFDGSDRSLPPQDAQLTVSLILAAIHEANTKRFAPGLISLDSGIQKQILAQLGKVRPNVKSGLDLPLVA